MVLQNMRAALWYGVMTDARTDPGFVLVVDDDYDIREMMETVLGFQGLRVATAANGADALGLLRRSSVRPHLIILDLMMPIMNGYEFRQEQLRDPDLADIPVVVVTGFGNAPTEARRLGAAEGLDKPLSLAALGGAIRRLGCSDKTPNN